MTVAKRSQALDEAVIARLRYWSLISAQYLYLEFRAEGFSHSSADIERTLKRLQRRGIAETLCIDLLNRVWRLRDERCSCPPAGE